MTQKLFVVENSQPMTFGQIIDDNTDFENFNLDDYKCMLCDFADMCMELQIGETVGHGYNMANITRVQ